ncbi:MAG: lipoprotein-releasing system permease [Bacteroidetes bacterium]|nr:MAG: lipoprotein-releasing system permease [Bacteroidota bacterium]
MNFEYFISLRLRSGKGPSFSRPIIRVSIAGIALGLAVMLISLAILQGFQKQVQDKVAGFGAHIQITGFSSNNSYEPSPVSLDDINESSLKEIEGVTHIQPFGLKAGIIKTDDQIHGVVLKGVNRDYNWLFFSDKLTAGALPEIGDSLPSNEVLISGKVAKMLGLKTGDDLRMYFIIDNSTRGRKFTISGIYETGLGEFDETYVFGDIGHIRKLNDWDNQTVSGVEIYIDSFDDLNKIAETVYHTIGYNLNSQTIKQLYPQIFDWIEIQDVNVIIILILMALVSGITMISTLLILILERTRDIGILKALGSSNGSIRKIFIYASVYITGYGLLWGNIIALGLILLQSKTEIIPLPEESYFVSHVPVFIGLTDVLLINLATIFVCTAMMLLPSLVVKYISPVTALRYD